ncbi:MAG: T9SS type A sorting domain-containing protein, partial [Bacteroidota bacterium]
TNNQTNVRPWAFSEIFKLTPDSSDGKSIRNETYKLIKFDYGQEEFYNLNLDPLEENNLLSSNLSPTDITSYNYLCNEMVNLTGNGNLCSIIDKINLAEEPKNLILVNPFESKITLKNKGKDDCYELFNNLGSLIYKGKAIELEDFSYLSKGIYILKITNKTTNSIKLLKN